MHPVRKMHDISLFTPELCEKMETMWKHLYATGQIDRPFDRDRFDYLANLIEGRIRESENKS